MRTTECLIDIDLTYPKAKQIATVDVNNELYSNCKLKCINDKKEFKKIASCEPGLISLDGTYAFFPEDPEDFDTGYWSSKLSKSDGTFDADVILHFSFEEEIASIAVTLYFGDAAAKDFTVEWLSGDTIISTLSIADNELKVCVIENAVENYDGLNITFTKADPYRYIKLNEIDFGKTLSANKEIMLKSAKINECTDLLCNKIGIGTLDFELVNKDLMFYMLKKDGYYNSLQENQKVLCNIVVGGNSESRTVYPMGTYYLSQWDNSNGSTAKFEAVNIIGKLEGMRYTGSFDYTNVQNPTAADFFGAVFACAGIDEDDYIIDDGVGDVQLAGYFPECCIREALQLLCIATQSTLKVRRDGKIHIFKPDFTHPPTEIGVIGTEKIKKNQGNNDVTVLVNNDSETKPETSRVIKDNPFIIAQDKAMDIQDYWNGFLKNKCIEMEIKSLLDFEMNLSDMVNPISNLESLGDIQEVQYAITEIETDLTGGCIANIKGVGEIVANT